MGLKAKVKVSEVNNLSEARYAAGMGVEMIGFPLDENHPRFVELTRIKEIAQWVCGVKVVGEFQATNIENINYLSENLGLDYVQIPHPIPIERISEIDKPVILELKFSENPEEIIATMKKYKSIVSWFLLKFKAGFNIESSVEILSRITSEFPVILAGAFTSENVIKVIGEVKPWGIDLMGEEESRPGVGNFDKLADILEVLEED